MFPSFFLSFFSFFSLGIHASKQRKTKCSAIQNFCLIFGVESRGCRILSPVLWRMVGSV